MHAEFKRTYLIPLLVLAVSGPAAASAQQLAVGKEFPTFTGKDFMTSEKIDFASFRGKVVIVEFWGTWCPPCRAAVPHIRELYEKQHEDGLEIISIASERRDGQLKPFIEKQKMTWHHIKDERNQLTMRYGVRGFPSAFVIDRDGILAWAGHPMSGMDQVVAESLKKKWKGAGEAEESARPELEKAHALRDEGKEEEAATAYREVYDNYPGTHSAREARRELIKLDKAPPSSDKGSRAARASASERTRWLKYARTMKDSERYDRARKYYQKVIDKHPNSDEAKIAKKELEMINEE